MTWLSIFLDQSLLRQIFSLALRELVMMIFAPITDFELLIVMALSWVVSALLELSSI